MNCPDFRNCNLGQPPHAWASLTFLHCQQALQVPPFFGTNACCIAALQVFWVPIEFTQANQFIRISTQTSIDACGVALRCLNIPTLKITKKLPESTPTHGALWCQLSAFRWPGVSTVPSLDPSSGLQILAGAPGCGAHGHCSPVGRLAKSYSACF